MSECGDNALAILIKADSVVTKSSATDDKRRNRICAQDPETRVIQLLALGCVDYAENMLSNHEARGNAQTWKQGIMHARMRLNNDNP
jgi:hypothetical protein